MKHVKVWSVSNYILISAVLIINFACHATLQKMISDPEIRFSTPSSEMVQIINKKMPEASSGVDSVMFYRALKQSLVESGLFSKVIFAQSAGREVSASDSAAYKLIVEPRALRTHGNLSLHREFVVHYEMYEPHDGFMRFYGEIVGYGHSSKLLGASRGISALERSVRNNLSILLANLELSMHGGECFFPSEGMSPKHAVLVFDHAVRNLKINDRKYNQGVLFLNPGSYKLSFESLEWLPSHGQYLGGLEVSESTTWVYDYRWVTANLKLTFDEAGSVYVISSKEQVKYLPIKSKE